LSCRYRSSVSVTLFTGQRILIPPMTPSGLGRQLQEPKSSALPGHQAQAGIIQAAKRRNVCIHSCG
jgi:hypothetical protein